MSFLGKPLGPCLMGVILSTQGQSINISHNKLIVKVGSMPSITLQIPGYISYFPVLFMITDIPVSEIRNNTTVAVLISNPKTIIDYEARERAVFTRDSECTTLLFKVSQESKNLERK
jgi:hypothetical protein